METEKKKFILDVIMVIFVAISIVISIRSCNISNNAEKTAKSAIKVSENSNRIAEEALETSMYQFIQVNRPYIVISLKKYENGQFWKVILKNKDVEIDLRYEMKNVGNVAAKDVSLPSRIKVGPKMNLKKGAPIVFEKPGQVTLGPGEYFDLDAQIKMIYDNIENARKQQEYLLSDKSDGAFFHLTVSYKNEVDESQKYKTIMVNRIHNDTARVIKSEMLMITEDEEQKEIIEP